MQWLVLHQDGAPTAIRQVASEMTVDCGGGATYARALRMSLGGPTGTLDEAQRVLETLALGGSRGHRVTLADVSSEAPVELDAPDGETEEDREMESRGHFWSIAIGATSLLLLAAALVLRGRTTRPK